MKENYFLSFFLFIIFYSNLKFMELAKLKKVNQGYQAKVVLALLILLTVFHGFISVQFHIFKYSLLSLFLYIYN